MSTKSCWWGVLHCAYCCQIFGINFALPQTPGAWFGGHGVRGEITNTELRTSPGENTNVVFAGGWSYTTTFTKWKRFGTRISDEILLIYMFWKAKALWVSGLLSMYYMIFKTQTSNMMKLTGWNEAILPTCSTSHFKLSCKLVATEEGIGWVQ